MTKAVRNVLVSVEWGYELHDCPMSQRTWDRIVRGHQVRRVQPYLYGGKRFIGVWDFNSGAYGQLEVVYDDGGVGFVGPLTDSVIRVNDGEVQWAEIANGRRGNAGSG